MVRHGGSNSDGGTGKMSRSIKQEASELIGFYEARGWDWTSALAFILCRNLFGKDFRIIPKVSKQEAHQ